MNNFEQQLQNNNIEYQQNNSDFIQNNNNQQPNLKNNNNYYINQEGINLQNNINYQSQNKILYLTKLEFFQRKWVFFGLLFFAFLAIISIIIISVSKRSRLFFIILLIIFIIIIIIFLLIPYTIIVTFDEETRIISIYKQNTIRCSINYFYIKFKANNIKFFRTTKKISCCYEDYFIHASLLTGGDFILFQVGKDTRNVDFELDLKNKLSQMNAWLRH